MEKYISLDFLKMFLEYDVEKDRYYIKDIDTLWGFNKEEMQPIICSSWKKVGDKFFCEACSNVAMWKIKQVNIVHNAAR